MRSASIVFILVAASSLFLGAETKAPPTPTDYGQWETLVPGPSYGGLSPDGKWLAYGINRSNRNNELRITNLADGKDKVIAFGAQPEFSSDSRWVAYGIELPEAAQDKLRKEKKPVHKKLGLLKLGTGEETVVEGIEAFAFSPNGAYVAMRRYAPEKPVVPEKKDDADASSEADARPGATLIVRQLAGARDTAFGNVAEFVWQDLEHTGRLLAMAISAEDKAGNGVQLYDPETGSLRVLDSSLSTYSGIAWRKNSGDLAVLRTNMDDRRDGPTQVALAWSRLNQPSESNHVYDPTKIDKFPAGMRIVSYRKPSWSEEGDIVFLGLSKWDEKPPDKKKPTEKADVAKTNTPSKDDDEPAGVDVWHWRDTSVLPRQKIEAKQDRERNLLAAWHIGSGNLVPLGRSQTEQVTPLKYQKLAYAQDWTAFAMERTIGRPAADLYLVDVTTGKRTKVKDRILDDRVVQPSPKGGYLLYFQGGHYWTVDTATLAVVNVTAKVPASFVDHESDSTGQQKPPFGIAGWTKDDQEVILYSKFDLWLVKPDGSGGTRLTDGEKDEIRHRYVRLDPDEKWIDRSKPIYLSLFGIWTKKSGYARLQPGVPLTAGDEHLVWRDQIVSRLAKAKDAEVYEYTAESFEDSPNAFVGADLKDPKQVTKTNPFQGNYAWGHSQLIDYKSPQGERLQGALYYPAGYQAGKKYPMIVYLYEKLSDQIHRYPVLSERVYYNPGAMTSHGYFVLMPDIVFRPREPGVSVVECITAALKQVFATGMVDAGKVGVVGHSWGGFDTAFLATHTDLFAAAVAGAPITDLVSNYGNHHWRQGIAETDHIETGQQRMQVPLWEDLQAYIRNSAVFNAQNMKTPLLIEVGDNDGTVFFHQGVELYNVARRAGKNVVMLVYAGEDHGLSKKQDQIDYQRRIFAWFGHYLKDEPPAAWITGGEGYLERQKYLKMRKAGGE